MCGVGKAFWSNLEGGGFGRERGVLETARNGNLVVLDFGGEAGRVLEPVDKVESQLDGEDELEHVRVASEEETEEETCGEDEDVEDVDKEGEATRDEVESGESVGVVR